jgi:hypothetical protein
MPIGKELKQLSQDVKNMSFIKALMRWQQSIPVGASDGVANAERKRQAGNAAGSLVRRQLRTRSTAL